MKLRSITCNGDYFTGKPYQPIIHRNKCSVTAVSVVLAWEPYYDGGHTQAFSIMYKTKDDGFMLVSENIKDPGMGTFVYTDILNLIESTCYKIKVISKNGYKGGSVVESGTVDLCTNGW